MSGPGDPETPDSEDGGGEGADPADGDISPWSAEFEFTPEPEEQPPLGADWTARRPAANAPIEFNAPRVFAAPAEGSTAHGSADGETPGRDESGREESRREESGREPSGPLKRQRLIGIVALVVAAVVAVVAVVAVSTQGDEPVDEPVADGSDVGTTLPAASAETTSPDASIAPNDEIGERGDSSEIGEIELPPDVAAIDRPTELVMTTVDGLVHTLSLPSGRVRTVGLDVTDEPVSFWGIVVSPDAAAFPLEPSGMAIVPRTGPPLVVGYSSFGEQVADGASISPNGWYLGNDEGSVFDVTVSSSSGAAQQYTVDLQGRATLVTDPVPNPYPGYYVLATDGSRIVNEAGGAYELAADGSARRIENGWVVAASGDYRLVRTCDEALACSTELVTASTGRRTALGAGILPDESVQPYLGMTLSPDGRAVAVMRDGEDRERDLVMLGTGDRVTYRASWVTWSAVWAADGSGVFDPAIDVIGGPVGGDVPGAGGGLGIKFTSVSSGESVVFGEELGAIASLGVRWPEAELGSVAPVVTTRAVAPLSSIGPTGITLVAATRVGTISVVDIDANAAQTWEMDGALGSRASTVLAAEEGMALLPDSGGGALVSTPTVERALSDAFEADGAKLPGPDPNTVWVPSGNNQEGDVEYVLLPLTAASRDDALATISISDAELLGSDGTGRLVVVRGGDVFIADAGAAIRLTSGELVAISADVVFVRECDDLARCLLLRVDRVSGQRTSVDNSAGRNVDVSGIVAGRGAALATSVAPGGEVFVTQVQTVSEDDDGTFSSKTTWAFVDLVGGTVTAIDDFDDSQPIIWSGDAQFAAVRSGVELHVYDRAGGRMVPLDMEPVVAIGPAPLIAIG